MVDLEKKLYDAVLDGRPISHRPWKKILIIVEGVYRLASVSDISFSAIQSDGTKTDCNSN